MSPIANTLRDRLPGALAVICLGIGVSAGQSMDPRAYSPSPTRMNFVVANLANSRGDVVLDPSLPLEDVSADVNMLVAGYVRTFGLGGRLASFGAAVPYVRGRVEGLVFEEARIADRSGFGDAQFRFFVNLVGGPALDPKTFAATPPRTTLGASLVLSTPTGEYFPDKLVNIGTHRWAVRPELGLVHPRGPWTFEFTAGVWLFSSNDNFFGGQTRRQDPLAAVQGHVSYTFRPRFWVAASGTWYSGGQTTVDGVENDDRQSNSRAGVTLSVPASRQHSLKAAWARGVTARVGTRLDTITVGWVYSFYDKP